jgi:type IV secretory pathway ATPase VirB11/archaellum biosynthesis ATPase
MSVTRFGQLVIGPPGSGKTTYVKAMSDLLRRLNRKIAIVNLGKLLKGLSHELYWLLIT